mmetsp:Transcript_28904/g.33000  ORF Transcript_28904/g.33000 Transcript_28904/m.33000 type:complete len:123 (-) Transcript_28904:361-729(-)
MLNKGLIQIVVDGIHLANQTIEAEAHAEITKHLICILYEVCKPSSQLIREELDALLELPSLLVRSLSNEWLEPDLKPIILETLDKLSSLNEVFIAITCQTHPEIIDLLASLLDHGQDGVQIR